MSKGKGDRRNSNCAEVLGRVWKFHSLWIMDLSSLKPPEFFQFPFPPYEIQEEFMRHLYQVLKDGGVGIFESPTGTVGNAA